MAKTKTEKVETKKEEKMMCDCTNCGKWATASWVVLLVGGLAHMLPNNMAPILNMSVAGITVQTLVGVVSVILALNFLLRD